MRSSSESHEGMTAIHFACLSKSVDLVKFLISKGADINDITVDGVYSSFI